MRLVLAFAFLTALAPAQQMDPDFAKSVKEWTTKPEFTSPLVDHLPLSTTVPSPKQVLGHHVGAPKVLSYYADLLKYYRALAAASPRVRVIDIGKTDEGRESIVVVIAEENTLKNIDTYRHYLAQLADPGRSTNNRHTKSSVKRSRSIT